MSNLDHQVKRFTTNLRNDEPHDILAETVEERPAPFLERADYYTGVVESASVDLSGMILNPNPGYQILILNNNKTGRYPGLPLADNVFTYDQPINHPDDVIDWLYQVFHKSALPDDLGDWNLNAEGYFSFRIPNDAAYASGDIVVYFNAALRDLLSEFCTSETAFLGGTYYYRLGDTVGATPQVQQRYTLSRMMSAVAVYFYTDLPTTPHYTSSTMSGMSTPESIFASITLNRETFDLVEKRNMIYSPMQYKHVTMSTPVEVQRFRLWIKIYYKDGRYVHHILKPGDFSVVNIAFYPRPELLRGLE